MLYFDDVQVHEPKKQSKRNVKLTDDNYCTYWRDVLSCHEDEHPNLKFFSQGTLIKSRALLRVLPIGPIGLFCSAIMESTTTPIEIQTRGLPGTW